ncbi:unnamed protein product [Vitrella brassicaformis CCMP3155]|uniref:Uncharacterized protein n=1 Tax=Vitrella brassicaformis (strain CCMP3155) TaxID=1169540 RepID=A0A0G4GTC0_VITBC|nr:unnamed protein product [Vitrella brassicaformis CCMP3155]|eukprot:CEM33730.1 unnamed protein product [Vitrella brassicaformis CCMP3155]
MKHDRFRISRPSTLLSALLCSCASLGAGDAFISPVKPSPLSPRAVTPPPSTPSRVQSHGDVLESLTSSSELLSVFNPFDWRDPGVQDLIKNVGPPLYLVGALALVSLFVFPGTRNVLGNVQLEQRLRTLNKQIEEEDQQKGSGEVLYGIGRSFLSRGMFEEAALTFTLAKELWNPLDTLGRAVLSNAVGLAYFRLKKTDEAIHYYKQAIRLVPDYITAHSNLGHAYALQGDLPSSLETFQTVLKLDANHPVANRVLDKMEERYGKRIGEGAPGAPPPSRAAKLDAKPVADKARRSAEKRQEDDGEYMTLPSGRRVKAAGVKVTRVQS